MGGLKPRKGLKPCRGLKPRRSLKLRKGKLHKSGLLPAWISTFVDKGRKGK